MQIEGRYGSKTVLKEGIRTDFGRGRGFDSSDRTVSRRHVSFELHNSERKDETRASFEIIGKNPIWVFSSKNGEIRVFRRFARGEMEGGDLFCVSAKNPFWFTLQKIDVDGEDDCQIKQESGLEPELSDSLRNDVASRGVEEVEFEFIEISNVDPVKEFGLVAMGHELDCHPDKVIRDIKDWNWFLEEPGQDSEDDEVGQRSRGKKNFRRKRKKSDGCDVEWMGESEDDRELVTKTRKIQPPKYSTKSKDRDKLIRGIRMGRTSGDNKAHRANEEYSEDEDGDTLGGFIVNDDTVEEEEENDEEEDEEDYEEDSLDD